MFDTQETHLAAKSENDFENMLLFAFKSTTGGEQLNGGQMTRKIVQKESSRDEIARVKICLR